MSNLLNTLENGLYPNYLIKTSILVLLANGANPNAKFPDGTTALEKAMYILEHVSSYPNKNKYILHDREAVINALIDYGARLI